MDQVNLSLANRRVRKGWISSNNTRSEPTLDIPSPPSAPIAAPLIVQSMAGKETRRTRIGAILNLLLAWLYVLFWSVPWISRRASYVQICVMLYVLFSLVTFNPLVCYHWVFSGGTLNLVYQLWSSSRTTSSRPDIYEAMPTSLLFSKLSPHLGNLAPNAVQIVFDSLKHEDSTGQTKPEIASCVWIADTHIRALESWTGLGGHPLSVLLTTGHSPGSPEFRELTKDITGIFHRKPHLRGTIVLISTQTWLPNTNAYINLSRLFARTDWVLLVPPTVEPLLPSNNFVQSMSRLDHQVQTLDSALFFRPSSEKGRILDAILIPQTTPLWCSERYYLDNVEHEWSDCIQEISSYYHKLGASNSTDSNEDVKQ